MERYFEAMLPAEELEQLKFIPTIPEFVEWMEKKCCCHQSDRQTACRTA